MEIRTRFDETFPTNELDCAREIVDILFERSGLSAIVRTAPTVIVGNGNWISFTVDKAISMEEVIGLHDSNGNLAFVADVLHRSESVRSRTSPSLHLKNLGSNKNMTGHVDAFYYARNPFGHMCEFLKKKTIAPAELLRRIYSGDDRDKFKRTYRQDSIR